MTADTERLLAEIEARLKAATEGPWRYVAHNKRHPIETLDEPLMEAFVCDEDDAEIEISERDCVFIAHAREDIPWLLDVIRKKEQEK